MRTVTAFDGFSWDIELDEKTSMLTIRRTPFVHECAACAAEGACRACGKRAHHVVAVGEWNGESIELRQTPSPRGQSFNAWRYLPVLAGILHTTMQGR
jgi:hypothetical protein